MLHTSAAEWSRRQWRRRRLIYLQCMRPSQYWLPIKGRDPHTRAPGNTGHYWPIWRSDSFGTETISSLEPLSQSIIMRNTGPRPADYCYCWPAFCLPSHAHALIKFNITAMCKTRNVHTLHSVSRQLYENQSSRLVFVYKWETVLIWADYNVFSRE